MAATFTVPDVSVAEPELRIMVVDDEPMARQRIVRLLGTMAGVRVVGELGSGREALQAVRALAPDVVLLDIAMPGVDGLAVARRLAAEHGPLVVFVTAYDEHALEAFRLHAADYVLKPVDRARLLDAVEHARLAVRRARAERSALGTDGRGGAGEAGEGATVRFVVRDGYRTHVLPLSDVLWVESYGNYARVFTPVGRYLHRATLTGVAQGLARHGFIRIHRTVVVNAARIVGLEPKRGGRYHALLDTGARLPVGRTFRGALSAALGGGDDAPVE